MADSPFLLPPTQENVGVGAGVGADCGAASPEFFAATQPTPIVSPKLLRHQRAIARELQGRGRGRVCEEGRLERAASPDITDAANAISPTTSTASSKSGGKRRRQAAIPKGHKAKGAKVTPAEDSEVGETDDAKIPCDSDPHYYNDANKAKTTPTEESQEVVEVIVNDHTHSDSPVNKKARTTPTGDQPTPPATPPNGVADVGAKKKGILKATQRLRPQEQEGEEAPAKRAKVQFNSMMNEYFSPPPRKHRDQADGVTGQGQSPQGHRQGQGPWSEESQEVQMVARIISPNKSQRSPNGSNLAEWTSMDDFAITGRRSSARNKAKMGQGHRQRLKSRVINLDVDKNSTLAKKPKNVDKPKVAKDLAVAEVVDKSPTLAKKPHSVDKKKEVVIVLDDVDKGTLAKGKDVPDVVVANDVDVDKTLVIEEEVVDKTLAKNDQNFDKTLAKDLKTVNNATNASKCPELPKSFKIFPKNSAKNVPVIAKTSKTLALEEPVVVLAAAAAGLDDLSEINLDDVGGEEEDVGGAVFLGGSQRFRLEDFDPAPAYKPLAQNPSPIPLSLLQALATKASADTLGRVLEAKKIRLLGDLAGLSVAEVCRLPIGEGVEGSRVLHFQREMALYHTHLKELESQRDRALYTTQSQEQPRPLTLKEIEVREAEVPNVLIVGKSVGKVEDTPSSASTTLTSQQVKEMMEAHAQSFGCGDDSDDNLLGNMSMPSSSTPNKGANRKLVFSPVNSQSQGEEDMVILEEEDKGEEGEDKRLSAAAAAAAQEAVAPLFLAMEERMGALFQGFLDNLPKDKPTVEKEAKKATPPQQALKAPTNEEEFSDMFSTLLTTHPEVVSQLEEEKRVELLKRMLTFLRLKISASISEADHTPTD